MPVSSSSETPAQPRTSKSSAMSTKLGVKQNKKDGRPKSSDRLKGKRRDGTPDKSASLLHDAHDENTPPIRQVIWDEELQKLQVKAEDLDKICVPQPPQEERPMAVSKLTVRKLKPASERNKPKMTSVLVAKPASPDAPIKPIDYSGYAGPRYDQQGRVLPYSILGTYEDYRREAINKGDLLDIPTPRIQSETAEERLTVKYEKKRKRPLAENRANKSEDNALRNWQLKMMERKRQQGYISSLLQKAPEDLVMNQGENYRTVQEDRYLIDRTLPYVDYGKGYRVGSEYWKQQERFGDEEFGVHMTLTQSERGYPAPVEHVGLSDCVKEEKGVTWGPEYRPGPHHPWHQSSFLQQRRKQLQHIMKELDPHKPDFTGLQVIGTNDPQHSDRRSAVAEDRNWDDPMEEEYSHHRLDQMSQEAKQRIEEDPFHQSTETPPMPIFGPSLRFGGQAARWMGDSHSLRGQVGIEARVTFEGVSGTRVTSYLEVINDGTTSVFFDWKKLPKENPFNLVQKSVQKFYFNNGNGVVLPGETMQFPFVFKSGEPGVYSEQWLLETRPVLCNGAALVLTLRGAAIKEDNFEPDRERLQRDLQAKEVQQTVAQILDEMIRGIRTPIRARSPVDAYITEEDIFLRHNPGLVYRHEAVTELKQLHRQLLPEEERDSAVWGLSIPDLRDMVMELVEDGERREACLSQLNAVATSLSQTFNKPVQEKMHHICHELLVEGVEAIVTHSDRIRAAIGMPPRESTDLLEETADLKPLSRKGTDLGDSRKGARSDKGAKDKKANAQSIAKANKGPAANKGDSKAKSTTPLGGRMKSNASLKAGDRATPDAPSLQDPPSISPALDTEDSLVSNAQLGQYRQKLAAMALQILGDKIQEMDHIFQSLPQPQP